MVNKLHVCCLDNEKQNTTRRKPRGRLRQSEVFFPLVIVANRVVSPAHLSWSYPESSRFSIVHVIPIKCGRRQHCLRCLFGFWGVKNYPSQIKRLPWTCDRTRRLPPSVAINTTTTFDSFEVVAEKYLDSQETRLHGKTFRIQKFSDPKFPF